MRISPVHVGLRIKINPRFPAGTTQTHCGVWMWDSRLNAMNIKTISNCILQSNRLSALKAGLMEESVGARKTEPCIFFFLFFFCCKVPDQTAAAHAWTPAHISLSFLYAVSKTARIMLRWLAPVHTSVYP